MNGRSQQQHRDDRGAGRHRPLSVHVPVLLYHSVSNQPAERIAEFSLSVDEFKRHVETIATSGREALSIGALAQRLAAGERAETANLVCVTFDDGWADNLVAAELLAAAGIPATVYVTSGFLGSEGMLSHGGLRELAAISTVEIGAHSVKHPRLDELSRSGIDYEVRSSKAALEATLSSVVGTFAYPHGAYDRRVREAVIDEGFTSAAAVKNAFSHAADDRFAIARWTVPRRFGHDDLADLIDGRGAPIAWHGERLRTRGYRAFRRLRRRAGLAGGRW